MATGGDLARFLEDIDEKVLECQICFNRLNKPRTLTCLHSFCLSCLDNWLKKTNKVSCPTCSKSYQIPEGGLKKLQPNTFLNNLLETIEQFSNTDQIKCICGKEGRSKTYCQECRRYLCHICSDAHKNIPSCKNHKLHSVEDVISMSVSEINGMHPPMCSVHNEPLTVFCKICKVAICIHCSIMDHKEWEGKDKHVTISIKDAFKTFQQTSAGLERKAKICTAKLKHDLKVMTERVKKLDENREKSLKGIQNHVKDLVTRIKESEDKLKSEVETMYKIKRKATDADIEDVTTTISYINTNINLLHHLGKGNEAMAMLSGNDVIIALDDRIKAVPKTKPDVHAEIKFVKNQQIDLLQTVIGIVTQSRAGYLELRGAESMTLPTIDVKIIKTDECEIHANNIKATLTQPTGETIITEVEEDDNGDYTLIGSCTSAGICKVDVRVDGEHIKKSPITIKVDKEGLLNTIQIAAVSSLNLCDVVKYGDDCLLVSCYNNNIQKYQQSGNYIGEVTLSEGFKVDRMLLMNNGNIAFSIRGNKSITVCTVNGEVVKSFGKEELTFPRGIYVDEVSHVMFVADHYNVAMFNIESGNLIKKIAPCAPCDTLMCFWENIIDVALTRQGYILVLYCWDSCLKLFDNEGKFIKVLVDEGDVEGKVSVPRAVVVDNNDNIIISSRNKVQLFSNSGKFIKRIDKAHDDGISCPEGCCIISHNPRRVAVANRGKETVKIFNY